VDLTSLSDKELVNFCLLDSKKHQEHLYRIYADDMFKVCLVYTENEDDASDVLQEGYIRVFRYLPTFRFESSLKTWIRHIIVSTAINYFKKKKRIREVEVCFDKEIDFSFNDNIFQKLEASDIVNLVNKLPERAKMVLKLYAIEGYKHKEIAEMMEISEGTSKSQLNRAKELLKEMLEIQYGRSI
jgi:RNA polymerase sigma factor (sigma-70 family)